MNTLPFEMNSRLTSKFFVDQPGARDFTIIVDCESAVYRDWKAATNAGYDKVVAPNKMIGGFIDTAIEKLVGQPIAGLVAKEEFFFTPGLPVYVGERIEVEVSVEGWNPLGRNLRLRVITWKTGDNQDTKPVFCHGFVELHLKEGNVA